MGNQHLKASKDELEQMSKGKIIELLLELRKSYHWLREKYNEYHFAAMEAEGY